MPSIHDALGPLAAAFRRRRLTGVCRTLGITPATRVLDVGGVADHWALAPVVPRLTILNLYPASAPDGVAVVVGDGRALPFADGAFDVVYANSVIEHLGSWTAQQRFAGECARVGRAVCVQTPNRWFPVEPHYLTPLVHWLPRALQRRLVRYGTVWGLANRPPPASVADMVDQLRLLTAGELRRLFPGARIDRERVLGATKSLTAVRHHPTFTIPNSGE